MKAIIQGEFHTSSKDREALKSRISPDTDALFVEGRADTVNRERLTIPYVSFLTGALLIFWIEDKIGPENVEVEIPRHENIDIPFPELYSKFPTRAIVYSSIFPILLVFYALYWPQTGVPLIDSPMIIDVVYEIVLDLFLILGAPLVFSFGLILYDEKFLESRDEQMSENIHTTSHTEGYDTVVISCGQAHVTPIESRLQEKGWETESYDSEYENSALYWEKLT